MHWSKLTGRWLLVATIRSRYLWKAFVGWKQTATRWSKLTNDLPEMSTARRTIWSTERQRWNHNAHRTSRMPCRRTPSVDWNTPSSHPATPRRSPTWIQCVRHVTRKKSKAKLLVVGRHRKGWISTAVLYSENLMNAILHLFLRNYQNFSSHAIVNFSVALLKLYKLGLILQLVQRFKRNWTVSLNNLTNSLGKCRKIKFFDVTTDIIMKTFLLWLKKLNILNLFPACLQKSFIEYVLA
jgi:hypothetical protein